MLSQAQCVRAPVSTRLTDDPQPFFHLIANGIAEEIGEDSPRAAIATTMVAYATYSLTVSTRMSDERALRYV